MMTATVSERLKAVPATDSVLLSGYEKAPAFYRSFQTVDKLIIKAHAVKYITNTADNAFRTDKELIFS